MGFLKKTFNSFKNVTSKIVNKTDLKFLDPLLGKKEEVDHMVFDRQLKQAETKYRNKKHKTAVKKENQNIKQNIAKDNASLGARGVSLFSSSAKALQTRRKNESDDKISVLDDDNKYENTKQDIRYRQKKSVFKTPQKRSLFDKGRSAITSILK
ncbi:MAG: hypothetical protein JJV93_02720 [Alphaproteobacteria bacterium]|nr:hypothetical protein [Alphaproteobacteria bacterium]MBL0718142.1 hypothetical protein [Alphaproteobacteria bacterium]